MTRDELSIIRYFSDLKFESLNNMQALSDS